MIQKMSKLLELCSTEKRAALIDAVSHRIHFNLAAEANGISSNTMKGWIDKAQADMTLGVENEHTEFYAAMTRAQMTKIREHLDIISSRPEGWEADAWILSSVYGVK